MPEMKHTPLNGVKTHPLSSHALGVLEQISKAPMPRQEVNPGVVNRLQREDLVEIKLQESPYKSVKCKIQFLFVTDAGRAALKKT